MSNNGNSKLQTKNFAPFPHFDSFLNKNELDVNEVFLSSWNDTFLFLVKKFGCTFLTWKIFKKYCRFVNNPSGTSVGDLLSQGSLLQEEFIVTVRVPIFVEHWGDNLQFYPNFALFSTLGG